MPSLKFAFVNTLFVSVRKFLNKLEKTKLFRTIEDKKISESFSKFKLLQMSNKSLIRQSYEVRSTYWNKIKKDFVLQWFMIQILRTKIQISGKTKDFIKAFELSVRLMSKLKFTLWMIYFLVFKLPEEMSMPKPWWRLKQNHKGSHSMIMVLFSLIRKMYCLYSTPILFFWISLHH